MTVGRAYQVKSRQVSIPGKLQGTGVYMYMKPLKLEGVGTKIGQMSHS